LKLRKLQSKYLLDLEDAVAAVTDKNGKVKLNQAVNLTAAGALVRCFGGRIEPRNIPNAVPPDDTGKYD